MHHRVPEVRNFCKRGMYSHCRDGGWILGYTIDGTQAEYVRIPQADGSLYHFPARWQPEEIMERLLLKAIFCPPDSSAMISQRTGETWGRGCHRRRRSRGPRRSADRPILFSCKDLHDRPGPQAPRGRQTAARAISSIARMETPYPARNGTNGRCGRGRGHRSRRPSSKKPSLFARPSWRLAGRIANVGVHGEPVELHMEKAHGTEIFLSPHGWWIH